MFGLLRFLFFRQMLPPPGQWIRQILLSCCLLMMSEWALTANSPPLEPLKLTAQESSWLNEHPVLKLGINRNFAPYEWIDERGTYNGIAADYIHLLEQRLGVRIEPVIFKTSWSDGLQAAQAGEFDIVSCLVETTQLETYLLFSKPYLSSFAVIISKQSKGYIDNLHRLDGKTVAIHKGHYTNKLLKRDYPAINIVNTPTLTTALRMVSEGRADAFVGDATAASYTMKQERILNLSFSGHTDYQSDFRMAVNKDNPVLSSIIEKTLASITQQERAIIYDRWSGLEASSGIQPNELVKYTAAVFLLLLVFIFWNYRLRRSEISHRVSEQRFRELVDTTDAIVWEADVVGMNFNSVSANAERLLGYKRQDWTRKGFWQEHIHPQDRQRSITFCHNETSQHRDHVLEYRFSNKQGETIWLRHMVNVVLQNKKPRWLRGLLLNITDQKMAEQLVLESELRFRQVIESLPAIAVQGYDVERRVIYWNDASADLYGYSNTEAIGRRLEDLIIPPEAKEQVIEAHQSWLRSESPIPAGEVELLNKKGARIPVFSSHVMLYSGGQQEMYCIDISLAEQKKANERLAYMAHFDPLTQLPNRTTFYDRLAFYMKKSSRNRHQVAVLLMDLDHFKEINDTLGHDHGDLLLQQAACRLQSCIRDTDTVARLGGDEFTIIIDQLDDFTIVERIAQNILTKMRKPFNLNHNTAYVSASIGIAFYPSDADSIDMLLKNADQAMYAAKSKGRNSFLYFTPAMEEQAQRRRLLINDLRSAISLQQLELFYQPIIDFDSGAISKAEALIRWHHPERGLVSPDDFISMTEETGLILEIGDWVFATAIQQAANWQAQGHHIQVSINTSPVQFRSDECDLQPWLAKLKAINLNGAAVNIEITEGGLMEAGRAVTDKLLAFKNAGIEVSLDDFGTGYSSLSYLKRFHIDYLKIDQSFVRNLQPDSNDHALCEAIIVMAHKLDMKVIAEGVETEQQRDLLISAGCNYGQGFLFSEALPATEFALLLDKQEEY
ncbi:EAL domain-containing protein [Neptunomonas qingdaonensis]|uniref:PAS domain S-box-containing protein/diguanylate cyclase (GGDEF) domain-containing protein n=1 Tax=Neptunomonas qingdaonensis TaxID=1045558 RepID=A0A1I2PEM8_9GAMM|nr:EAL domain-containing protein [Neptunomonas qingdaonensis]SFG13970.1 PAS domain S-box-containing protein/diguanylate cyclase (GGDEF) domain-containing protein [Neptunomonas qingdaonensis]